ncbi:MAG: hypothetical protein EOO87_02635 [Pedobacter sp.]|nr:MAG: hypothetical protein EOO87_02635 [Pedobacter sp.]
MRKLIIIFIITSIIHVNTFAQSNDQASLTQSLVSKSLSIDSALIQLYNFSKENPFFIEKMMPQKFNNLSVTYEYNKGRYIPVQGASKTQALSLFSEGKTTLEKFNLYGSFKYVRATEDSTRWAHQSRLNTNTPYYFGSIKNNHYERSVYKINAAVSRAMIGDNLPISLGVDYRLGNHFSNKCRL